jgi:ribosome biogenesis GTPase
VTGLESYGWNGEVEARFAPCAAGALTPGRVIVEHKSRYVVATGEGERAARCSGKLRYQSGDRVELPAVGDWVALKGPSGEGEALIHAVVPRTGAFTRRAAGRHGGTQVLAANVDVVFIVASLARELNARRLERYLTLAWESGASPVVVLNKADLCDDLPRAVGSVESVTAGVSVHVASARTGAGVGELGHHLSGHRTGALLGPSGVGKSTLVNRLCGEERQVVGEVRVGDLKGRHTTARRELIILPGSGILIDTPGMRELQLSEAEGGLAAAFSDITELAEECGFRDCRHGPEPGCAVTLAVEEGRLDAERLESWRKLMREIERHEREYDQRKAALERQKLRAIHRAHRDHTRRKRG